MHNCKHCIISEEALPERCDQYEPEFYDYDDVDTEAPTMESKEDASTGTE